MERWQRKDCSLGSPCRRRPMMSEAASPYARPNPELVVDVASSTWNICGQRFSSWHPDSLTPLQSAVSAPALDLEHGTFVPAHSKVIPLEPRSIVKRRLTSPSLQMYRCFCGAACSRTPSSQDQSGYMYPAYINCLQRSILASDADRPVRRDILPVAGAPGPFFLHALVYFLLLYCCASFGQSEFRGSRSLDASGQCVSLEQGLPSERLDMLMALKFEGLSAVSDVVAAPDGRLFVVGVAYSDGFQGWIASITANGSTVQWVTEYSSADAGLRFESAVLDAASNSIVVSGSVSIYNGTGSYALLYASFDFNGGVLSLSAFDTGPYVYPSGSSVTVTPDARICIGGTVSDAAFSEYPFLGCTDASDGAHRSNGFSWMVTLPTVTPLSYGSNPSLSSGSGGICLVFVDGSSVSWLVNFASNGTLQWASSFGASPSVQVSINALTSLSDGTVLLCGSLANGSNVNPLLLLSDRPPGSVKWAQVLPRVQGNFNSVFVTPNGNIIVVGIDSTNYILFLASFTVSGSLVWSRSLALAGFSLSPDIGASGAGSGVVIVGDLNYGDSGLYVMIIPEGAPTFSTAAVDTTTVATAGEASAVIVSLAPSESATLTLSNLTLTATSVSAALVDSYKLPYTWSAFTYQLTLQPVSVTDAVSTILWTYRIPYSVAIAGVPANLQFTVSIANGPWMSYNSDVQSLSGYPLEPSDGLAVVNIAPNTLYVTGVGTFSFPSYELLVCVDAAPTSFLLTISYSNCAPGLLSAQSSGGALVSVVLLTGCGVMLMDVRGDVTWAQAFALSTGSPESAFVLDITSIATLAEGGGAIVAGGLVSYLQSSQFPGYCVGRLNSSGTLEWAVQFYNSSYQGIFTATAPSLNGNILVTGGGISPTSFTPSFLMLGSVTGNGDLAWMIALSDVEFGNPLKGFGLAVGVDQSVYVFGSFGYFQSPLLCKFSPSGNVTWAVTVSPSLTVGAAQGALGPDGTVYALYQAGEGSANLLVAFTAGGAISWVKSCLSCAALAVSGIGSLILTGQTGGTSPAFFIAGVDASGSLLWMSSLCSSSGGPNPYFGTSVLFADNGDILVSGQEFFGLFVARFNQFGHIYPAFSTGSCPLPPAVAATVVTNLSASVSSQQLLGVSSSFVNMTSSPLNVSLAPWSPRLSRSGFIRLPLYTQVPFGLPYVLNLSAKLEPGTSLTNVESLEGTFPSWLVWETSSATLTGSPFGNVRGVYCLSLSLLWVEQPLDRKTAGVTSSALLCLNVTNTPPYYTGSTEITVGAGDFSLGVRQFFRDNENDTVGNFLLWTVNGVDPSLQAQMDPLLGIFTASVSSNTPSGLYLFNITASDPFAAVGWFILTLDVQLPSALALALEKYWPLLVSGLVLVCVVGALLWRDRRIQWTLHNICTVAVLRCELPSGCCNPTAPVAYETRDKLTTQIVTLLDTNEFDLHAFLVEYEGFLGSVVMFAASGFLNRGFIVSLGLGSTVTHWCDVVMQRLVNGQLVELRKSRDESRLVYPVSYHRKTLFVLHLLNRLVETILLCYGLQLPDPGPVQSLMEGSVQLIGALRQMLCREPAPYRLRHGLAYPTLSAWLSCVGSGQACVATPVTGIECHGLGLLCESRIPIEIQILQSFSCLRQALLALPETSTSLDLFLNSLSNVLAPATLLKDLVSLVSDVPSRWYSTLYEARVVATSLLGVPQHQVRQAVLLRLQCQLYAACFTGFPSWNLVYGCVELLGSLLTSGSWSAQEWKQLTGLEFHKPGVLTLCVLSRYPGFRARPAMRRWVQEAARAALEDPDSEGGAGPMIGTRGTLHRFPLVRSPLLRQPSSTDGGLLSLSSGRRTERVVAAPSTASSVQSFEVSNPVVALWRNAARPTSDSSSR